MAEGLRMLEDARTTLDEGALNRARDAFAQITKNNPQNSEAWYQLARANRYRIEAYVNHQDKKTAAAALDDAIAAVTNAIKLNDKSADAHSLLADLYGRKISLGVFLGGPRFGPKVSEENKRALALDAANPRVHASLGRQYLMTPGLFGGDVEKAVDEFRASLRLDPKSDETYVWLAIACRKHEDKTCADKAIADALQLNPRSTFAHHFAGEK